VADNAGRDADENISRTTRYLLHMSVQFDDIREVVEEILGMYISAQMLGDLDQLAWNLVDCDGKRQREEFGGPEILDSTIKRDGQDHLMIYISAAFSGSNQALIKRMAAEYLAAFDDYIRDTILEYKSRTGERTEFDGRPAGYSYEISIQ